MRLIDSLLVERLGKPLGFADTDVVTLDPAVGTGTYLLGVIEHALNRVESEQGPGAVPGQATSLAQNLYGFELMVGPYAVSELRVSRALSDRGAQLPSQGTQVYLTDTLESPFAKPPQLPFILQPIAKQHARALEVKSSVPVIVCLGNPPYDRHEAATDTNKARTGGWVRHGDGEDDRAILQDFLDPAKMAGHGGHLKNLYNLYVYFWRWAMWKVFEQGDGGPGIVSFITASSYLHGNAFCGMREQMRHLCGEIWILDLGGEGHGSKKDDNVFAIQTPVAIAVAFRDSEAKTDVPARVHYARIEGTRQEKLAALDTITGFATVGWQECPVDWLAPFRPVVQGGYFDHPLLTDLMPWQQSGVKAGRTWVIAPEKDALNKRWLRLLQAKKENRKSLFKDSPTGRKVHESATQLPPSRNKLNPISGLESQAPAPEIVPYAYRSFDRQFLFRDARMLDRPGPPLWESYSHQQVFLTSSFTQPLGNGPALTSSTSIPDLHYYSGRGAKDNLPLYRDSQTSHANVLPGLLEVLGAAFRRAVTPEDFLAYVYGTLAQSAFTARFAQELGSRDIRVPITRDSALFERVRSAGAYLLWLHTYGERFVPQGMPRGQVPGGEAKCTVPVPGDTDGYPETFSYNDETGTLHVGAGEFAPVPPEIFAFEVSGLKVVQSWLKYRMKKGAGRKSSPLDDIRPERWTSLFTTELLELLWVLEATLATYPLQAQLLEEVIAGDCFHADELPEVPDEMRKPPKSVKKGLFG